MKVKLEPDYANEAYNTLWIPFKFSTLSYDPDESLVYRVFVWPARRMLASPYLQHYAFVLFIVAVVCSFLLGRESFEDPDLHWVRLVLPGVGFAFVMWVVYGIFVLHASLVLFRKVQQTFEFWVIAVSATVQIATLPLLSLLEPQGAMVDSSWRLLAYTIPRLISLPYIALCGMACDTMPFVSYRVRAIMFFFLCVWEVYIWGLAVLATRADDVEYCLPGATLCGSLRELYRSAATQLLLFLLRLLYTMVRHPTCCVVISAPLLVRIQTADSHKDAGPSIEMEEVGTTTEARGSTSTALAYSPPESPSTTTSTGSLIPKQQRLPVTPVSHPDAPDRRPSIVLSEYHAESMGFFRLQAESAGATDWMDTTPPADSVPLFMQPFAKVANSPNNGWWALSGQVAAVIPYLYVSQLLYNKDSTQTELVVGIVVFMLAFTLSSLLYASMMQGEIWRRVRRSFLYIVAVVCFLLVGALVRVNAYLNPGAPGGGGLYEDDTRFVIWMCLFGCTIPFVLFTMSFVDTMPGISVYARRSIMSVAFAYFLWLAFDLTFNGDKEAGARSAAELCFPSFVGKGSCTDLRSLAVQATTQLLLFISKFIVASWRHPVQCAYLTARVQLQHTRGPKEEAWAAGDDDGDDEEEEKVQV